MSKTYDGLSDLLLREQILTMCGRDLALYLQERKPGSVGKMASPADRYASAHRGLNKDRPVKRIGQFNTRDSQVRGICNPNQCGIKERVSVLYVGNQAT